MCEARKIFASSCTQSLDSGLSRHDGTIRASLTHARSVAAECLEHVDDLATLLDEPGTKGEPVEPRPDKKVGRELSQPDGVCSVISCTCRFNGRGIMPMSNHAARQGHAILRTILIALSIVVLAICVLMWWVTAFDAAQPMASGQKSALLHAPPSTDSTPSADAHAPGS